MPARRAIGSAHPNAGTRASTLAREVRLHVADANVTTCIPAGTAMCRAATQPGTARCGRCGATTMQSCPDCPPARMRNHAPGVVLFGDHSGYMLAAPRCDVCVDVFLSLGRQTFFNPRVASWLAAAHAQRSLRYYIAGIARHDIAIFAAVRGNSQPL